MISVFKKINSDDFIQEPNLNKIRIKKYRDIAKKYNVSESTIRDVFHLGINFAIDNMEEIQLPTEEEVKEQLTHPVNMPENSSTLLRDVFEYGIDKTYELILNKLKGG